MIIEPISSVGAAALPPVLHAPLSPLSESPLNHALSVETETLEQRANGGDLMALEELAGDEMRMIPIASQQLLPPQLHPSPPGHEPGKGDLIDIYD